MDKKSHASAYIEKGSSFEHVLGSNDDEVFQHSTAITIYDKNLEVQSLSRYTHSSRLKRGLITCYQSTRDLPTLNILIRGSEHQAQPCWVQRRYLEPNDEPNEAVSILLTPSVICTL